jgi:hypothetical protein
MTAKLSRQGWLFREWEVSTPAGDFSVSYSGRGYGFESVWVDGVIVAKTKSVLWYVPRFDFTVGGLPATIEIRVWPWLTLRAIRLRVGDQICYTEGFQ